MKSAKRGLDSICTSDTVDWPATVARLNYKHAVADLRYEQEAKEKAVRTTAYKLAPTADSVSLTKVSHLKKPYCDEPVELTRWTDPRKGRRSLLVEQYVPCRKCQKCLQYRQMMWRERMRYEIAFAPRTWFVTLTFSPVHLAGVLSEAIGFRPRLGREASIERAAYGHVQKFLKRLRKAVGTPFRYAAVYERGEKTGRSHYHLLLHEVRRPLTKRIIQRQWRSYSHVRLASKSGWEASYVSKYLLKSSSARLRSSQRYGQGTTS